MIGAIIGDVENLYDDYSNNNMLEITKGDNITRNMSVTFGKLSYASLVYGKYWDIS